MQDLRQFIQDLRFQRDKYSEMVAVTEEQQRLMGRTSDLDPLMQLIEKKRTLLDDIERVEQTMSPVKSRWATLRGEIEASLRTEVESVVDQIAHILEDLVRLEEQCHQTIQRERGQTLDELKQLWQRKQVRKKYGGGPSASGSQFLDQKE